MRHEMGENLDPLKGETTGMPVVDPISLIDDILSECSIGLPNDYNLSELPVEKASRLESMKEVSVHFFKVGVDPVLAGNRVNELRTILSDLDSEGLLSQGPTYIHLGGMLGDQGRALQLMAVGHVAGLWELSTPESLGIVGEAASQLAGLGMIHVTGFQSKI